MLRNKSKDLRSGQRMTIYETESVLSPDSSLSLPRLKGRFLPNVQAMRFSIGRLEPSRAAQQVKIARKQKQEVSLERRMTGVIAALPIYRL